MPEYPDRDSFLRDVKPASQEDKFYDEVCLWCRGPYDDHKHIPAKIPVCGHIMGMPCVEKVFHKGENGHRCPLCKIVMFPFGVGYAVDEEDEDDEDDDEIHVGVGMNITSENPVPTLNRIPPPLKPALYCIQPWYMLVLIRKQILHLSLSH